MSNDTLNLQEMVNNGSQDVIIAKFDTTLSLGHGASTYWGDDLVATSYRITKDFFGGPDTFSIEFEDDRADQLLDTIAVGMKVSFEAQQSGQQLLLGFVDNIAISPKRSGGKRMTVTGRDILGLLEDSSLYPNLGDNSVTQTYQFKPTDTLEKVVKTIFQSAPGITDFIINKDAAGLKASTGFGVGVRQKGKTGRGLAKNFKTNLDHLLKPEKGETYLGYAKRICTRAGCQIKMLPGSYTTIFIGPPTYDRDNSPAFSIVRHAISDLSNNVLDSRLSINYKDQPSIIIAEGSHGGPTFKKSTQKVMCINEFTGYKRAPGIQLSLASAIPNVKNAVDALTSGTTGYKLLPPNQDLYNVVPQTIADMQTNVSRPKYVVDYNAQTTEELQFYVAELMAHYQDQYFVLEYEMQGHSQGGAYWSPNLMVQVQDESFHPEKSINGKFWIRKVEFMRDRHGGCRTKLTLNLPYIHVYDITPGA